MLDQRGPISGSITWAMVAIMLWGAFPSSVCVCANGALKLYCASIPHEQQTLEVAEVGQCCAAAKLGQAVAGNNESRSSPSQFAGPGCSRVSSSPDVATVRITSKVTLDVESAVSALPPEQRPTPCAATISSVLQRNIGPPPDLVIRLHCLLI
jgi:hypothetical protein